MTTVDGEYTPSPTPKPHPRIKPEAASYADRNRGNMERWFDYSGDDQYESPRPVGRSVSDEGRKNADVNKGSMGGIMGGYPDPAPVRTIHPRGLKGDAEEIANSNKGGGMKDLIDNYGNLNVNEHHGHKVHGADANEYAERNHGTMDKLMGNYGNLTPDRQPVQNLSYGGHDVAEKHMGAGMGPILRMEGESNGQPEQRPAGRLHQTSQGAGWDKDPPAVRTRPEAEGIADKQHSAIVGNLMRGEVNPPTVRDARTQPHMQETPTPRVQTEPPSTRPEARHNSNKNKSSELSAIMHGESSPSHQQKRSNRMMQKSEDW